MAVEPQPPKTAFTCRLEPFHPRHADLVMSWVRDAREAYWIAPRTPPPLTADQVLNWQTPGHQPYLLYSSLRAMPVAYGELNMLGMGTARYWLGHLIVAADLRGKGLGQHLTRQLLEEAFLRRRAREVSLVVFPDNHQAIACYEKVGLRHAGFETHDFPAYKQRVRLVRMVARALPRVGVPDGATPSRTAIRS